MTICQTIHACFMLDIFVYLRTWHPMLGRLCMFFKDMLHILVNTIWQWQTFGQQFQQGVVRSITTTCKLPIALSCEWTDASRRLETLARKWYNFPSDRNTGSTVSFYPPSELSYIIFLVEASNVRTYLGSSIHLLIRFLVFWFKLMRPLIWSPLVIITQII